MGASVPTRAKYCFQFLVSCFGVDSMITIDPKKCPQNHKCPLIRICPQQAITQTGFELPKIDFSKCIE